MTSFKVPTAWRLLPVLVGAAATGVVSAVTCAADYRIIDLGDLSDFELSDSIALGINDNGEV
jgi:hypothetical protein